LQDLQFAAKKDAFGEGGGTILLLIKDDFLNESCFFFFHLSEFFEGMMPLKKKI
jgi:hypothetical protein